MAKKTKKEAPFRLSLKINAQEFSTSGDTIEGALLSFPKIVPKTNAILTINGKQIFLNIARFKRLFFDGQTGEINRMVLSKNYSVLHGK